MARTQASTFIIDTGLDMSNDPVITIHLDVVNSMMNAIDHLQRNYGPRGARLQISAQDNARSRRLRLHRIGLA